ncbi:MAG TPA: GNAT family N-acetyltransferase [Ilumatobacteraceae bacterium]|nr:GNAT family N-acetyltransferase [Ilumatobacteraceae bacterium]
MLSVEHTSFDPASNSSPGGIWAFAGLLWNNARIKPVRVFTSEELAAAGLRPAVIDVCIAAHDTDEFRHMFTKYFASGARHFLAYDGDTLVSHAVVSTRGAQPEGLPVLRTAFVDAVSTLPSHQNQGFGSATMQCLAENVGDYEIGCLQTDRTSFYARLGWQEWRGPLAGRTDNGLIATPEQRGVMVLPLRKTPKLDLDALLTIEQQPDRIWE